MHKACNNAFGLYKRTRPGAAAESVSRAKGMLQEGIHPLLAKHVPVTAISGLEAQVQFCCITFHDLLHDTDVC